MKDKKRIIEKEEMYEALKRKQFQVYYQPKYDMHTEMIAGAEALVRWIHPERGTLMPDEFLSQFEETGVIVELDQYVWECVCMDIHNWVAQNNPAVAVSVNISRRDILELDLVKVFTDLLAKYDIPTTYFHLEITEAAYANHPDQIIDKVECLRNYGFIIEMDDFGSGNTSLSMLAQLPVDVIKLDMEFIQSELEKTSEKSILNFVISLANWLKLDVVAEGVENAEQISSLLSMNCSYVQGFYYARPMTVEAFEALLKTSAVVDMIHAGKNAQKSNESTEQEVSVEKNNSKPEIPVDRKTLESLDYMIDFGEINRYRYILDNLDVAFFEINKNGSFYASEKFFFYALSEENIKNLIERKRDYCGIHGDDLPKLFELYKQIDQNLPKVTATMRLKMKDETYRWTEMMLFFEEDKDGKLKKTIGILRDVDKEWIRQNKELQDALEAAEKANHAKTDFLARVSHDMRTPLNGILGLSEIIKDKADDTELQKEVEQLEQSGKYLLNLIDDTLDVSQIESGKIELHEVVCDGKAFLETIVSMVNASMMEKNLQLNLQIAELPFSMLYIDAGRLEQAVMNIVSNAIKFTPEGGNIEIEMKNISVENGMITDKLVIRDNGIGMSEEFQNHLFESFVQEHNDSKSIYHGTGLGMTITKQCMDLMKGSISVKSKEGEGTEVTLILPMKIATQEQIDKWKEEKSGTEKLSFLSGKRILLCEDHPLNAMIATKLLEKEGMVVEHAQNGQEGVRMFAASELSYYDAILMDIRMPVMDGIDATKEIRKMARTDAEDIPIIAMTANVFREDVKNSINAGMSEHLGKPIDPEKLYRILADFIMTPRLDQTKKVLVVDDIEMNRGFVRKAIESKYTVLEAGSGVEALEMLQNQKDIDAVITDVQMPYMNGKELIKKIREDKSMDHIAILANTIYGDHRQEDELLALGANDFVYKPTSSRIILMRLEHIMRNW